MANGQVASMRVYSTAEGMRSSGADCLVEDAQDNLYACTYGGLYRYEGERFERVGAEQGLADAYVLNASPVPNGPGLWVGTGGNLYFWDGQRATQVSDAQGASIPSTAGHGIAALADGAVVISRGRALRVERQADGAWRARGLFDAATEQAHPELQALGAVYRDGSTLWLGCARAICRVAADGAVQVFGPGQGVPDDAWTTFLRDRAGTLWARSPAHVTVLASGAAQFVERPTPPEVPLVSVTRHLDLVEDAQGRILSRSDTGLLRWEGSGWRHLSQASGLPNGAPNSLMIARDGGLWMAYGGQGVLHWRGYGNIENWGLGSGLSSLPNWSLLRDGSGAMLFGNEAEIARLPDGAAATTQVAAPPGTPLRAVVTMARGPDGVVWAGLYRGALVRVEGGRAQVVASQLPYLVRRVLIDRHNRLWLCTNQGVYVVDDATHPGPVTPRRFTALPEVAYGDVFEDARGRLWFASKGALLRVDGQAVTRLRIEGRVPNQLFDKLFIDREDQLWVSVDDAGLFHGRATDGDTVRLEPVNDPLLGTSLPYFIRGDRAGRLWVGGDMGVDVLERGHWTRLDESSGLIGEDTSEGAFFEDADGSVWIGSSRGVNHLVHPERLLARKPLVLHIVRVERGGKLVNANASLPWAQLPIRMILSTPGTVTGVNALKFRYRLRGRQDAWIETTSRTLDFPLLGSGEQVVEVQALDANRRLQSNVATFSFEVRPPWWRSPEMLLLWTALVAALVAGVWRWRVRAIVKRKQELERLVAARTAELEADKRALEQARTALQVQATHDGLTGLHNRTSIMEQLERETQRAHASGMPLAVALLDLDHFKQVNDTHGHLVGDVVLSGVADRLANNMRDSDTIGRYGGEELLGVMPGLAAPADERLRGLHEAVGGRPLTIDGLALRVTCSVGVAWLQPGESPNELLRRADRALYQAKREGRNRVVVAAPDEAANEPDVHEASARA